MKTKVETRVDIWRQVHGRVFDRVQFYSNGTKPDIGNPEQERVREASRIFDTGTDRFRAVYQADEQIKSVCGCRF